MKRRTVMALMLGVALAATGCGQKDETKETTAPETAATETETETETEITLKDMPSYTASEFVTLGEYKGLEVTQEPAVEVTDEDVQMEIRAELEENALAMQQNAVQSALLQKAVENAEISGYPTEKIAWYVDYQKSYYEEMVQMYGMELGEFLTASGYEDEEAFMTEIEEAYKPTLEQEMVLLAIADAEAMEITDEEFQAGLEKYAAEIADMNGVEVTTEELLEQYGEAYVRESLLLDKAMEFLYENAEITEAASEETDETETEAVSEEGSEKETTEASETETEAVSEKTTEAASETEMETTTESETETEAVSETAETETEA